MSWGRIHAVGLGVVLAQCAVEVVAQANTGFFWGWGSTAIQDSFQECQQVPIQVFSKTNDPNAVGVPPYYFVAFEENGVPTVTPVGSNPLQLTWTANHKRGANLMLTLMDSNHSVGGVDTKLYTMTSGSDSSCIPSASPDAPSVTSNVTGTLFTCDPWGLTIDGGQKPYTLVFSALNSPTITNVTLQSSSNHFTYINRATPDGDLMVSVVDANGRWGKSSPIMRTAGSQDASCGGLESSESSVTPSGTTASTPHATSADPELQSGNGGNVTENTSHTKLIAGLAIGIGLPIIIGIGVIIWLLRKRNRTQAWNRQTTNILASEWEPPRGGADVGMSEVDAASRPHTQWSSGKSRLQGSPSNTPFLGATPLSSVYTDSHTAPSSSAGLSTHWRNHSEAGSSSSKAQQLRTLNPPVLGAVNADDIQPELIIQHRDAGVVQELPPPYMGLSPPQPPVGPSADEPASGAAAQVGGGGSGSSSVPEQAAAQSWPADRKVR